jgi:hypothetical protein
MNKILLLTLSLTSSLLLAQSSTTLSVGGTYSEGEYGTQSTTTSLYIPLIATYKYEMFEMAVTVPYIELNSEGSFTWTPAGPVPTSPTKSSDSLTSTSSANDPFESTTTTTTNTKTRTSGLGDINIKLAYNFIPKKDLYIKTVAIMKVATADKDKGLGTGENDYSIEVDIYKVFGKAYVYITRGYTHMGDSKTVEYNDSGYGSMALGYNFNQALSSGVNYSFRQAIFDCLDDTQSASLYLSYKPTKSFKIDTSYTYGLSDSTADNAYTLTLSKTF